MRGERSIAVNAVAGILQNWREEGKLYTTPPSSIDVQTAERIVYLVEKILKEKETNDS